MTIFDKLFRTSNKIKVQFIDSLNGQTIGVSEMTADQLPETFSVQTTMHIQDNDWNIEEAIPENSLDFIKTKSLVLKLRKIEKLNANDVWFTLPTISNESPQIDENPIHTEFDIYIHSDDYRQNEFLNVSSLPLIEREFSGIKEVWKNHSEKSGEYTLFKSCHVRKSIGPPNLTIPVEHLKAVLKSSSIGKVIIESNALRNGFAIKTENTTYYGTLHSDKVVELCIYQRNEKTTSEIEEINKAFNLLFVNWYNCDIIKND